MNKVREVRKLAGMSGEKLARAAEMSASDLSKLERGLVNAYPGCRQRIAAALGHEEEDLFPGVADAER